MLSRYHKYMKENYLWTGIIRLTIESYWDLCVGILLSWREPRINKPSDVFDLILTIIVTLVVFAAPIALYLLLRKYANELDS